MASRDKKDIDNVVAQVEEMGYQAHLIEGVNRTVIAAVGDEREKYRLQALESFPHVESVVPILKSYKLAVFCVMAGPCAVESREQIVETAKIVKAAGAHVLRGGAYKPRTSPYSFQGMEEGGLKLLKEASEITGMPFVTEVMTPEQLDLVCDYADVLQIGARNMQNYGLLKAVGKKDTPVFLKRGMMSTINEWLMSAEYIMSEGNNNIIMCERGIRTFETETRNTLDLSAVPVLKKLTHLPVVIDPSHGTGHWDYVSSMALAAAAAGADGLQIEVHPHPAEAFSDGPQSLKPKVFEDLMTKLKPILATTDKHL
jgi:3-deoxy-7-phosphoheptulonate synthase